MNFQYRKMILARIINWLIVWLVSWLIDVLIDWQELLQNADDAGAKNVIFLYDETQHPTNYLYRDSLKKFNGPALYVYNDATFTDEDWDNIQKPQQSGKQEDPTKVGQFGLGFISVYHITGMLYKEHHTVCFNRVIGTPIAPIVFEEREDVVIFPQCITSKRYLI